MTSQTTEQTREQSQREQSQPQSSQQYQTELVPSVWPSAGIDPGREDFTPSLATRALFTQAFTALQSIQGVIEVQQHQLWEERIEARGFRKAMAMRGIPQASYSQVPTSGYSGQSGQRNPQELVQQVVQAVQQDEKLKQQLKDAINR